MGPLGLALTLHPMILRTREEIPNLKVIAWYLNDSTLYRSPRNLVSALEIIEEMGADKGFTLSQTKSLLYILADADISETPFLKFQFVENVSFSWVALFAPQFIATVY